MSDKPTKSLYHSAAVQLGQVECLVKSGPTKSRHSGKPDYCSLIIKGEEKYYNVENPSCAAALKHLVGKTVILEFLGGRDDASISVIGQPQQPAAVPDLQRQPDRQRTVAPKAEPKTVAENLKEVRHYLMQQANLRGLALDVATYTVKKHNERHPDYPLAKDDIRELSSGYYIGAERRGMADLMPTVPLEDKPKVGAK